MNDEPYLLKRVLQNWEDDTARLVYADWLEENSRVVDCDPCGGTGRRSCNVAGRTGWEPGDTECENCLGSGRFPDGRLARAEFIRTQCGWANQDDRDRVERELWGQWWTTWCPPCPTSARRSTAYPTEPCRPYHGGVRYKPARGFVEEVALTWQDWMVNAQDLVWRPGWERACPNCLEGDSNQPCGACRGTGVLYREPAPTAHPVLRVRLTDFHTARQRRANGPSGRGFRAAMDGTHVTHDLWPGLRFLPPED